MQPREPFGVNGNKLAAMANVKDEHSIVHRTKKPRAAPEEPGMLKRVGAAVGVCSRPPTAAERAKLVTELEKNTKEDKVRCAKLLDTAGWALPKAMQLWAGEQGAVR